MAGHEVKAQTLPSNGPPCSVGAFKEPLLLLVEQPAWAFTVPMGAELTPQTGTTARCGLVRGSRGKVVKVDFDAVINPLTKQWCKELGFANHRDDAINGSEDTFQQ